MTSSSTVRKLKTKRVLFEKLNFALILAKVFGKLEDYSAFASALLSSSSSPLLKTGANSIPNRQIE